MKVTIKSIWKSLSRVNGNSLAEFATVSALMATLAATAAPKLSEVSEGTKAQKTMNEIDKLLTQAKNFYQDKRFLSNTSGLRVKPHPGRLGMVR